MNAIVEIAEHFRDYYGQERILVIVLLCVFLSYLYFPAIKRIILYPTLLLVIVLINPLLYQWIFHRVIYWRLLWMIPGTFIIAYIICQLIKMGKTMSKRIVILIAMCLLIVFSGNYAYSNEKYRTIQNLEKIDQGVKEVGRIILDHCDSPKCLLRTKYLSQIRQYSTEIELLYGRNVYHNYITGASDEHIKCANEMEKEVPDYAFILEVFKNGNCNIIAVRSRAPIPDELLTQYGLYEITRIDQSIIYKKQEKK